MFIDPQDAERRLTSQRNYAVCEDKALIVPTARNGRGSAVPFDMKAMIGILAHFDTQKNVADAFDVTQPAVSGYKHGKVGDRKDEALEEKIESSLGIVRDKALERLLQALDILTPEKMEKEKARGVASIAADMGKVVEKTLPRQGMGPNVNLVVYAPLQRSEEKYKIVEV